MYLIGYWDSSCLQHLIIQLLLLHLCKLIVQLGLVDCLAKRCAGNGVGDLLAEGVLLAKLLPRKSSVGSI